MNIWAIVAIIWQIEGGDMAQFPYGIRSIPCDKPDTITCRQACYNTVYRTLVKYRSTRCKAGEDDISCLARRYAPLNSSNDPKGLNLNWERNFRYHFNKLKEQE